MKKLFLLSFLLITNSLSAMEMEKAQDENIKNIIFELDDILFSPDPTGGYLKNAGILKWAEKWTIESTEKKLIELLKPLDLEISEKEKPIKCAIFRESDLPMIWCLYLMNKRTGEEIQKLAANNILNDTNFLERPIINMAMSTAFTPLKEAAILIPKEEIIDILQRLDAQKTNHLFILANKRSETLEFLRQKYPEIFKFFEDRIHVSGETEKLKPNIDAYKHLLSTFNLDPKTCYIVEKIAVYANAAEQQKMIPIKFNDDVIAFEEQLKTYSLLPDDNLIEID